jgi:hypothetical protein
MLSWHCMLLMLLHMLLPTMSSLNRARHVEVDESPGAASKESHNTFFSPLWLHQSSGASALD